MKPKKTYDKVVSGKADNSIDFTDLQNLLSYLGFINKNIKGDHFIYALPNIVDNINIQPNGNKAKAYQVKQIRNFFKKHNIKIK